MFHGPRLERVLSVCGALLVAAAFWAPALVRPFATGFGDWQMVHHNWEVGYVALTRFGQWPLWNPYFCGGIPMFGNPESQHFSPLFLPALLFGATLGVKLFGFAHTALGVFGMYRFARDMLRVQPPSAALAALVWSCSGFFAWQSSGGHATFLPFYFAPLLLWCFRKSWTDPRHALGVAAILAWVLMEGGTYPFPYFVLLLAVDGLCALTSRERCLQVARSLAIAGPLALLWGAVRLLPIRESLARMPRTTASDDALQLTELFEMFTARTHGLRFGAHRFVWAEYGSYLGAGVLLLVLIGVPVVIKRRQHWIALGLLAFGALMLGERGPLAPWSLLHRLPVFDSLRVPSRFGVLVTFYMLCCAAVALELLTTLLQRRFERTIAPKLSHALPWLVVLSAGVNLFVVNVPVLDRWRTAPISERAPSAAFYLSASRNIGDIYVSLPHDNLGTAGCYAGAMNWKISRALWSGKKPQVRFVGAGAHLIRFERSVNGVSLTIHAREPVRAIVNQNFDDDWRSDTGQVVEDDGRLAIDLPAGDHDIELRYVPRTLTASFAAFVVGCMLAWFVLRRSRKPISA